MSYEIVEDGEIKGAADAIPQATIDNMLLPFIAVDGGDLTGHGEMPVEVVWITVKFPADDPPSQVWSTASVHMQDFLVSRYRTPFGP